MDALLERAKRIKLLVLDVDGVLTDGRLYISPAGEELKVFHVRDGSGLVALQRAGVTVAIISGRDSAAVTRRAAELGIRHVRQGVGDKAAALGSLLRELGLIRDGGRGNSNPAMAALVKGYSAADLQAVADHMSRLPPPRK